MRWPAAIAAIVDTTSGSGLLHPRASSCAATRGARRSQPPAGARSRAGSAAASGLAAAAGRTARRVRSTAGLRCFALVDRARDGFLTVRFLAGFFLGGFFLAAFFLTAVLLAGFFAFVRAFRREMRGFRAFALDAFRFLPFAVRLALVVLARFTRLAFARFFFIAPSSLRWPAPPSDVASLIVGLPRWSRHWSGILPGSGSSRGSEVTILCFATDGWSRFGPWTRCTRTALTPPSRPGSATSTCASSSSARKPT